MYNNKNNKYCRHHYNYPTAFISLQVWRIGIMGYNSTEWHTNKALSVFKDGLLHIGYTPKATKMKAEL